MASSDAQRSLFQNLLVAVLLSLSLVLTSCDAKVKGCPFDSIYSFGVRDSSLGSHRGSLMVDQLATAFHLPSPKLYAQQQYDRLHYGAAFATESAIALEKPFLEENGIQVPSDSFTDSITSQLVSFTDYLTPICWNRLECRHKLQRALFIVDIGSNDYKYAFLNGKSIQEVEEYTPLIANNIIRMLLEIWNAGASNIVVPGMLPLGCLPGYLSLLQNYNPAEFDADNCHIGLNGFAKNHNDQLKHAISHIWSDGPYVQSQALSELGESASYSQILYADYYNSFMALLRENSNNRKVLFREDGFHLSEEANKYIVRKLISGNNFIQPEIHLPNVNHCVM